jgi:hypothetical protein
LPDAGVFGPPRTVAGDHRRQAVWELSLDDAIRIALANSEVVRTLVGATVVAAGPTIYDPAVSNTQIDQNRADFDPTVESNNTFFRTERPQFPFSQFGEGFRSSTGVQKKFITGGTGRLDVNVNEIHNRSALQILDPETTSDTALSLNQPLLQGAALLGSLTRIQLGDLSAAVGMPLWSLFSHATTAPIELR